MTALVAAYALGAAMTWALWRSTRPVFDAEVFARRNYRDHPLPTGVGLLLPAALAVVVGTNELALRTGDGRGTAWEAMTVRGVPALLVVVGFAYLGLVDDLGGVGESGGFRGHLRALRRGRATTGLLKMAGGPVIAVVALGSIAPGGVDELLRDAAVVALAANLANLLDRAPGRVNKTAQLAVAALALATRDGRLAPVAVVAGSAAALLRGDLREQFMLGDAGANSLGAAVGLGVVIGATGSGRWAALAVLVVANAGSELVSYSRVIDRFAPLRVLDRWGSPHRRR